MMDQEPVEAHVLGAETLRQFVCDLVERALIADHAEEATLPLRRLKTALELCSVENLRIVVLAHAAERRRAPCEARPRAPRESGLGGDIRVALRIPHELDARLFKQSVELRPARQRLRVRESCRDPARDRFRRGLTKGEERSTRKCQRALSGQATRVKL